MHGPGTTIVHSCPGIPYIRLHVPPLPTVAQFGAPAKHTHARKNINPDRDRALRLLERSLVTPNCVPVISVFSFFMRSPFLGTGECRPPTRPIQKGVATLRRHVDKSGNKLEPPLRGPSRLWRENAKSSEHADHDLQAGYFDIPGSCAPPKPLLGQQAIHSTVAYPSS